MGTRRLNILMEPGSCLCNPHFQVKNSLCDAPLSFLAHQYVVDRSEVRSHLAQAHSSRVHANRNVKLSRQQHAC